MTKREARLQFLQYISDDAYIGMVRWVPFPRCKRGKVINELQAVTIDRESSRHIAASVRNIASKLLGGDVV